MSTSGYTISRYFMFSQGQGQVVRAAKPRQILVPIPPPPPPGCELHKWSRNGDLGSSSSLHYPSCATNVFAIPTRVPRDFYDSVTFSSQDILFTRYTVLGLLRTFPSPFDDIYHITNIMKISKMSESKMVASQSTYNVHYHTPFFVY